MRSSRLVIGMTCASVLAGIALTLLLPTGGAAREGGQLGPRWAADNSASSTHFQWFKVIRPSAAGTRMIGPLTPGSALAVSSLTVAPGERVTVSLMRRSLTRPSDNCESFAAQATLMTFTLRDETTHLAFPEPFIISSQAYWCLYMRTSAVQPIYATVVGYTF